MNKFLFHGIITAIKGKVWYNVQKGQKERSDRGNAKRFRGSALSKKEKGRILLFMKEYRRLYGK